MEALVLGMQAPEEENQELAALLAEWDDGNDSYGSAQDSPRTSLLQSQQHQYLQQHQQVRLLAREQAQRAWSSAP